MIATHGSRNPKMNRNFLGDDPFFLQNISIENLKNGRRKHYSYLRMVQEKVALSRPRVPQTSSRGGRIMPKEKIQTPRIMSRMFSRL